MPPTNSPGDGTPETGLRTVPAERGASPQRSMTPMSYLSAPVPNFAAGLYPQPADAADEANTTFLRQSLDLLSTAAQPSRTSAVDQSRDPRLGLSRRERNNRSNRSSSPVQRDHLHRYLTHLYRMHHPPASRATAYSNRTPSPHRQSLYDWAPAANADTRQQGSIWAQSTVVEGAEQPPRQTEEPLPSATERMLRYFMDRERSGLSEEEERARGAGWYRPRPTRPANTDDWHADSLWSAAPAIEERPQVPQEEIDAFRREYLSDALTRTTTTTPRHNADASADTALVETAVKYLDDLRHCHEPTDVPHMMLTIDLIPYSPFLDDLSGVLTDLEDLTPLQWTSWLHPGSVFEGHQYASTAILPRSDLGREQHRQRANDHPPGSTHFTGYREMGLLRSYSSAVPLRALMHGCDHWPVRMIIHTVNTEDMTLQGTMEAYDVPQHTFPTDILSAAPVPKAGKKSAPITTYVEGQIIDCRHHSFLTPKPRSSRHKSSTSPSAGDESMFPAAKPSRDAENWKKLPPFNDLTDKAIAETLLLKDKMNAINEQYIFMRWKERCFVHGKDDTCSEKEKHNDHDKGHGLTISGFYYISMRRCDGSVEGLYYDPNSTPYQHLRLKGLKPSWPACSFR